MMNSVNFSSNQADASKIIYEHQLSASLKIEDQGGKKNENKILYFIYQAYST